MTAQESRIAQLELELAKVKDELVKAREALKQLSMKLELLTPPAEFLKPTSVTVDAKKTAVMVVDMQNDFCNPKGSLFVGPSVEAAIPCIKTLLDRARGVGIPIIYTQDWHAPDDPEFAIWPIHCVRNTWGAEVVEELKPKPGDIMLRKMTYDSWFKPKTMEDLEDIVKRLNVTHIIVVGTVSHICVMHAVAGAALRGYKVVVPIDCISSIESFKEFSHQFSIFQMKFLYGADITKVDLITFKKT